MSSREFCLPVAALSGIEYPKLRRLAEGKDEVHPFEHRPSIPSDTVLLCREDEACEDEPYLLF